MTIKLNWFRHHEEHLYLQRRIIALEERVAMLETKQEILLEALNKIKGGEE